MSVVIKPWIRISFKMDSFHYLKVFSVSFLIYCDMFHLRLSYCRLDSLLLRLLINAKITVSVK